MQESVNQLTEQLHILTANCATGSKEQIFDED